MELAAEKGLTAYEVLRGMYHTYGIFAGIWNEIVK